MAQGEHVRRLKKLKALADYLQDIKYNGHLKRPYRKNICAAARKYGYTQDVVEMPTGALVSAHAAEIYFGHDWYTKVRATDLECLTELGSMALQELHNSG